MDLDSDKVQCFTLYTPADAGYNLRNWRKQKVDS